MEIHHSSDSSLIWVNDIHIHIILANRISLTGEYRFTVVLANGHSACYSSRRSVLRQSKTMVT